MLITKELRAARKVQVPMIQMDSNRLKWSLEQVIRTAAGPDRDEQLDQAIDICQSIQYLTGKVLEKLEALRTPASEPEQPPTGS